MTATLDKVAISVRNPETMAEFYKDTFGALLSQSSKVSGLYVGRLGEIELMLCPNEISGVNVGVNNIQLRFVVLNVEETHRVALAHGGTAISPSPLIREGCRIWDVRDPDGNSIELREA